MQCLQCNNTISDTAKFCKFCGKSTAMTQPTTATTPEPEPQFSDVQAQQQVQTDTQPQVQQQFATTPADTPVATSADTTIPTIQTPQQTQTVHYQQTQPMQTAQTLPAQPAQSQYAVSTPQSVEYTPAATAQPTPVATSADMTMPTIQTPQQTPQQTPLAQAQPAQSPQPTQPIAQPVTQNTAAALANNERVQQIQQQAQHIFKQTLSLTIKSLKKPADTIVEASKTNQSKLGFLTLALKNTLFSFIVTVVMYLQTMSLANSAYSTSNSIFGSLSNLMKLSSSSRSSYYNFSNSVYTQASSSIASFYFGAFFKLFFFCCIMDLIIAGILFAAGKIATSQIAFAPWFNAYETSLITPTVFMIVGWLFMLIIPTLGMIAFALASVMFIYNTQLAFDTVMQSDKNKSTYLYPVAAIIIAFAFMIALTTLGVAFLSALS